MIYSTQNTTSTSTPTSTQNTTSTPKQIQNSTPTPTQNSTPTQNTTQNLLLNQKHAKYNKLVHVFKVIAKKYNDAGGLLDKSILLDAVMPINTDVNIGLWFDSYKSVPKQRFAEYILEMLDDTNYMLLDNIIPWYGLSLDNNNMIIGQEDFIITRDNIAPILLYGLFASLKCNKYYKYLTIDSYSIDTTISIEQYAKNHYLIKLSRLGLYIQIYDSANCYTGNYRLNQKAEYEDCGQVMNITIDINDLFYNPISIYSYFDYSDQIRNSKIIESAFSYIIDSLIKKVTCINKTFYHYYIISNIRQFFIDRHVLYTNNVSNMLNTSNVSINTSNVSINTLAIIEELQNYEYIYDIVFITYAYKNNLIKKSINIKFMIYILELDDNEIMSLYDYLEVPINQESVYISWIQFINVIYNYDYKIKTYTVYIMDKLAIVYTDIYKYLNTKLIIQSQQH